MCRSSGEGGVGGQHGCWAGDGSVGVCRGSNEGGVVSASVGQVTWPLSGSRRLAMVRRGLSVAVVAIRDAHGAG